MLERALKLRPVYFHWREEPPRLSGGAQSRVRRHGFIAQEVQKILSEMVTTDQRGYLAVDYAKPQYVLLGALQEEHEKVQSLEARIAKLEAARLSTSLWGWFAGLGAVSASRSTAGVPSSTRATHSPSERLVGRLASLLGKRRAAPTRDREGRYANGETARLFLSSERGHRHAATQEPLPPASRKKTDAGCCGLSASGDAANGTDAEGTGRAAGLSPASRTNEPAATTREFICAGLGARGLSPHVRFLRP